MRVIERNSLLNGVQIQLEDWSDKNTDAFPNLHGLCIAAYPIVARRTHFTNPGARFRLQISQNPYTGYSNEMVRADYDALVRGEKQLEDLAEHFYYGKRDEFALGMGTAGDYNYIV